MDEVLLDSLLALCVLLLLLDTFCVLELDPELSVVELLVLALEALWVDELLLPLLSVVLELLLDTLWLLLLLELLLDLSGLLLLELLLDVDELLELSPPATSSGLPSLLADISRLLPASPVDFAQTASRVRLPKSSDISKRVPVL